MLILISHISERAAVVTFTRLGVGDLQVAISGLEPLAGHDLPLELAQRDVEAVECDGVVVQFGRKFIVNTRHFHTTKHLLNLDKKKTKQENVRSSYVKTKRSRGVGVSILTCQYIS